MAKVFTITEGLENLGAVKTGGQGSVYKAKRTGEIISAVKLLPTPIISEDPDNKQYTDFTNEVNKLKKVNEEPNPNIVRIVGSGITETGGFPFIEMEFIEGPDLGELSKTPDNKIFTIKEIVKVCEHLSNALAHCHKLDVKHGDIKSNNVKLNRYTGNYVLLDFGMAVMSDEQRRTSLRNAGAIEFMAPEQNEGRIDFQTDVYSFGIIIFELLTGQVPFPLNSNSETARNNIMLAHMESAVPDLILLRKNNLPPEWPDEKKNLEMQVPAWLSEMVYKCLEKLPENRFANGHALHDHICTHIAPSKTGIHTSGETAVLQQVNQRLQSEKEMLHQQLENLEIINEEKEKELVLLRNSLHQRVITPAVKSQTGISKAAFSGLLLLSIILASLAAYGLFFRNQHNMASPDLTMSIDSTAYQDSIEKAASEKENERLRAINTRKENAPVIPDSNNTSVKKDSLAKRNIPAGDTTTKPAKRNSSDEDTTASEGNDHLMESDYYENDY